jgi:hypothetical protein
MPSQRWKSRGHRESGVVVASFFHARLGAKERGAEAVEFALVVPWVVLLLCGVIDLGYMINRDTMVNNASREGAREGSYNPVANSIKCKARQSLTSIEAVGGAADCAPSPTKITVAVTCRKPGDVLPCTFPTDAISGGTVIVKVDYVHSWITPLANFAGSFFSNNITLSKTTEMRIE